MKVIAENAVFWVGALGAVFSGIGIFVIKPLKTLAQQIELFNTCFKQLMRIQILSTAQIAESGGDLSDEFVGNISELYALYKKLGGNGPCDVAYSNIKRRYGIQ